MVIKEGYKQTEVGVIPSGWEVKSIKNVAPLQRGFDLTNSDLKKGIYPVVYSNGIVNFHNIFQVKAPGIVTGRSGTIGKVTFVEEDYWPHNTALWVTDFKNNNPKFIYYLFLKIKLERFATGSGVPTLNRNDVHDHFIPLPTLAEQTAIATALSDADALITSLEKLIAKKRNIKQGTMQQLLQPKEGWEVKKLGEVATIVRGASPRPIEDTKWFDKQSPIGWVRISDVTKSKKVLLETTQKLSDLGVKNSRLVENGNLIMSICATVGRPILTTFDVCIHDGFVVFKNPQVDRQYLYYFLTFIEDNWAKSGQTGSQMNLNTTLINNTEIPFPKSPEEQTRIATILSDMDAELTVLEQKLEKYKKIKLGMMQELLTGKTRLI
ncbi:restriction endonuclease subunit S [Flavobacterium sp. WC2430]|uniref:restriction endonuclease subunit S n=1 Tax=Flavobacterium sp. WC2430 TaxID=3234137 RepID=UPI003466C0FC